MSPEDRSTASLYGPHNRATRIDVFDELGHTQLASLRSFFRRLGAPHLLDEVVLPTLDDGDSSIFAAVRDRPWPPWGVGARLISAVCQVQEVSDESYALSPVYVTDEDATNVGLVSALYKEVLESLLTSPRAEVNYLVAEGSILAARVLDMLGFKPSEDVFLTEASRYYTWRIAAAQLHERLGLNRLETVDLLADDIPETTLMDNALLHQTVLLGILAEWRNLPSEIIGLVRGGHAGKPGGVPGGTGRWGGVIDPPYFVTLENFLGDVGRSALRMAVEREQDFVPAKIHDEHGERVDQRQRRNRVMTDLGGMERDIAEQIKEVLEPTLTRLGMEPFPVGEIEIQLAASGDGDYFHMHRDADESSTRVLTFVCFLHNEPRRFSGGELRIFDNAVINGSSVPTDRSQLISPRMDVAVLFPSNNEHELLPVRVPSKKFADSRFTITGWIHREE